MLKALQLIYGFLKYMSAVKGIINWGNLQKASDSVLLNVGRAGSLPSWKGKNHDVFPLSVKIIAHSSVHGCIF